MTLKKIEILKKMNFGERVAEDEVETLERYFFETEQWASLYKGDIDVVFGPKGSGKSALYTLLSKKEGDLFDEGILLAPGENVRGETVFSSIVSEQPPSEIHLIYLWKLYSLVLVARTLREYDINNDDSNSLISALEKAGLLPRVKSLSSYFKAAKDYLLKWVDKDVTSVEHALTIDVNTGAPTVSRKTEFKDATELQLLNEIPVQELLNAANEALTASGLKIWLVFDRLDVAFVESADLERNALRALFRVYNDFKAYEQIGLKIFVRNDIWDRITEGGFREGSHITKVVNIDWTNDGLLNMIALRIIDNEVIKDYLDVNEEQVKSDMEEQEKLFYAIVPSQVDVGKRNSTSINWLISRCADGTQKTAPRELLHLLEQARKLQIQRLERGNPEPPESLLFERTTFKDALKEVSKTRLNQTLLSEYPHLREPLDRLKGEKSEHNKGSLSDLWSELEGYDTDALCKQLVDVGFFEVRGDQRAPQYWIPFLYRSALDLVQGKAD